MLEELRFTSPAFQKFQSDIAEAYLGTQADLSDAVQYAKLLEELLAYIGGKIHAGRIWALNGPCSGTMMPSSAPGSGWSAR